MAVKKKAPELSSGLLAVKGAAAPASAGVELRAPAAEPRSAEVAQAETDSNVDPLNFRVTSEFKRDFKVYAAQHGLKLNELLRRAFYAYRDGQG